MRLTENQLRRIVRKVIAEQMTQPRKLSRYIDDDYGDLPKPAPTAHVVLAMGNFSEETLDLIKQVPGVKVSNITLLDQTKNYKGEPITPADDGNWFDATLSGQWQDLQVALSVLADEDEYETMWSDYLDMRVN